MILHKIEVTSNAVWLHFSDGEQVVKKFVTYGGAAKAIGANKRNHIAYDILRKSREAERDFLYLKHGKEWQKFDLKNGDFWSDNMTSQESLMVAQALGSIE